MSSEFYGKVEVKQSCGSDQVKTISYFSSSLKASTSLCLQVQQHFLLDLHSSTLEVSKRRDVEASGEGMRMDLLSPTERREINTAVQA